MTHLRRSNPAAAERQASASPRPLTRIALAVLAACLLAATPPQSADDVPVGPQWKWPAAERVVAIGDLHGDLEATRRVLRLAGIIDENDRWSAGRTVVVQTGDQLDRGDGEKAIVDLLERLIGEAATAGGRLVVLNGNHELMNVRGDLRYVTPGGFAEFKSFGSLKTDDPKLARIAPGLRGRVLAFAPGGPYARILARRPIIAQVGDAVFVHGGVLPAHVKLGIGRINREVADWVAARTPAPPPYMRGEDSPVWSRHYSADPDASDCALLGETLAALGAKRMFVGHTVQKGGPRSACGGRVWRIDVGLSAHYGGKPAAIEIVGGEVRVITER